jgi:VCBS repeat protein
MNYPAGTIPAFIGTGDFDGDGKLDLAVANAGGDNVSILLGNGDGTFDLPVDFRTGPVCTTPPAPCLQPTSIAVGNFGGDGKPDLAITNFATNEVVIMLNTSAVGAPNFGAPTSVPVGDGPLFVTAGDFDGDSKLDLAVANTGNNTVASPGTTVSILKGDGTGAFPTKTDVTVGKGPVSIALGHFNNDANLDFAVANFVDNTISVFRGGGDATTFTQAVGSPITVGIHPISIASGDFNGDPFDDLAVANQAGKSISILLAVGDADGTFTKLKVLSFGKTPSELVVDDFNGDGAQDLAIATFPGHALGVILGNGDGTFTSKIKSFKTTAKSTGLFSIVAGDFNADSKPDLAIPNAQVSILLNTTEFPNSTAPITVFSPNGGTIWTSGTPLPQPITWDPGTWDPTPVPQTGTVTIKFSTDGINWKTLIKSVLNSAGTANLLKAPTTTAPVATARVRICSVQYPGICGDSALFTLQP